MKVSLVLGDCLDRMAEMPESSVDAVVTDPPYGLGFMGKAWDATVPGDFATASLRVLKPAHYLLAFGGTRTHHRLMVALEDAGFEIRDTLMWLYGSGFPKGKGNLKPAWEPIILCRKPGAKVRGLGIEDCRIEGETSSNARADKSGGCEFFHGGDKRGVTPWGSVGRWPANLILDEEAAAMLDEQSGWLAPGGYPGRRSGIGYESGAQGQEGLEAASTDSGGASRFFYCAKASRGERNEGCEGMEAKLVHRYGEKAQGPLPQQTPSVGTTEGNVHPTVKPVTLMRWLVRLISAPGDTVLDPFLGSGTTGVAAHLEGRDYIGIEREPEYIEIARARIAAHPFQGVLL